MVGDVGIGYMGVRQMLIATGGTAYGTVDAPVLGARFWFNPDMGLDVGLGFSGSSLSVLDQTDTRTDSPEPFTMILHAGLPFALADSDHFVFQVVPEINFGMSGNTIEGMDGADDEVYRGTHFDLGVRAGGEVHFGFIGVPQLSLQAGVGVGFQYDSVSYEDGGGTAEAERMSVGTIYGQNPWEIFTSSISALYYLDR